MSSVTCKAAKAFLASAASALVLAGAAFAAEENIAVGLGRTTGSGLRMREYPSTESAVLYKMEKGTTISILDEVEDGWYHVSFDGKTGYVSADYLKELSGDVKAYAKVNGQGVNVRQAPSQYSDVKQVIDKGAYVTVTGYDNGFFAVKCKYGTVGYIRSDYLDLTNTDGSVSSSSSSAKSSIGGGVVATAMKYKGYRYVYGGASPSGFDCSGFTMYVMAKQGVSLPHSASSQWTGSKGTRIYKMSALQPGDLVFFRIGSTKKAASHVGIYIGNNQMIHASSSRTGVIVSSLNSGSYIRSFVGGKRFL